jgi:hypothetical protein
MEGYPSARQEKRKCDNIRQILESTLQRVSVTQKTDHGREIETAEFGRGKKSTARTIVRAVRSPHSSLENVVLPV